MNPKLIVSAVALCGSLSACDFSESLVGALAGDCDAYQTTYQGELVEAGALSASIPATPDGFAMGLVLNQRAVNELFRRLGDTELPVLSQSFGILGQNVTVAIQPSIPTLAIGGNSACVDCFSASVPFQIGVGTGSADDLPRLGGGTLAAQLPLGMIPETEDQTALVASFQSMEVTNLDLDLGNNTFNSALGTIEPVVNRLLSAWLQSRFENARIATFDSWALGQGQVKLAGRGPFVHPATETIVVAMQSNLRTNLNGSMEMQTALPVGADIGFVFHPELLLSMTRRMHYEGVIPQDYDESGNQLDAGGTQVTFNTMASGDDGLLRTGATLYRTDNICGTASFTAAMGLSVEPGTFAFTVQDVAVTGGEGVGQLFSNDAWGTGVLVDSLLDTLQFTVNYDQIFGGETGEQPEMGAFQANIDARGISVYLNVADL